MSTIRGRRRSRFDFLEEEPPVHQVRHVRNLDHSMMVSGASLVQFNQIKLGDRIRAVYVHPTGSVESYEFDVAGWGEQGQLVTDQARQLAVAKDEGHFPVIRRLYRLP